MIKTSLKNFFKNLLYLFIPMGIVYLLFLFGILLFLASTVGNLASTVGQIFDLVSGAAQTSAASVNEFLAYASEQINWSGNFLDTIRQILDTNWLQNTFVGFFQTLDASTEGFGEQFGVILTAFKNKLIADLAVMITLILVGVLLANFATRYVLRSRNIHHTVKKFFMAHIFLPVAQWIVFVIFVVLLAVIRLYSFLVLIVLLAGSAVLSLFSAWFVHKDGKLKLRDVLTAKNILAYFGVIGIFLLIIVAVAVGLFFVNPIFAVLFLIPFAIYVLNIVDVNTESYLCTLVEHKSKS